MFKANSLSGKHWNQEVVSFLDIYAYFFFPWSMLSRVVATLSPFDMSRVWKKKSHCYSFKKINFDCHNIQLSHWDVECQTSVAFPRAYPGIPASLATDTPNSGQQSRGTMHCSRVCASSSTKATIFSLATATLLWPTAWTGSVIADRWIGTWWM